MCYNCKQREFGDVAMSQKPRLSVPGMSKAAKGGHLEVLQGTVPGMLEVQNCATYGLTELQLNIVNP